jgi:hypothetical protein
MLYKNEQPENENETEIIDNFSPESSYVDNCSLENAAKVSFVYCEVRLCKPDLNWR